MPKLRHRGIAAALVGTAAAGIMIASTGTASAAAWVDTPLFYYQYADCARVGQGEVDHGYAIAWACERVLWWDRTTYVWQLREYVG